MSLTVVMAQINLTVGDLAGNSAKVLQAIEQAKELCDPDIVLFPELTITGYPPEDLLLKPSFIHAVENQIELLCQQINEVAVVIGYPRLDKEKLYNSACLIHEGKLLAVYDKQALPNYSVFDEKRYFSPGTESNIFSFKNTQLGITICEDIWEHAPIEKAVEKGAQIILNLNASPFDINKHQQRTQLLANRAKQHQVSIFYCNLVGGQDELVFDGGSLVVDADGNIHQKAMQFSEQLIITDLENGQFDSMPIVPDDFSGIEAIYSALVSGIRDYVIKNGFQGAVLGLSGGIDSALVLSLAVDALGAENVEVVMMPSLYTSDMSNEDASLQADKLGVQSTVLPIEKPFNVFLDLLSEEFQGMESDITEENIQARCRGILLMAISNKKGKILLTTGNKSEMSVGYATLYGDMAGGFAPIKDCPKTLVYQLAEYCNRDAENIPRRVIERPPSAELRPDQKDSDSLPDYDVLDDILRLYVEEDKDLDEIIQQGHDANTAKRIIRLVDINEYKRRQAPPGVKITQRAYGKDRRYPMTNKFRSDML